ncbi:store-operated calcium entry-associated regulatory factor isoform 2-T2 [Liasis olivaceus]
MEASVVRLLLPLLVVLTGAHLALGREQQERILLREVQALTLHQGRYTNYRRTSPVPQLQCTGGSAGCTAYTPEVVQCYNKGWDGYDVQWECKAHLDTSYHFGKIEVSCEGYDYPDDPFILKGSCGLEYTLELTKEGQHKASTLAGTYYSAISHSFGLGFGVILVILFVVFVFGIYKLFLCDNRPQYNFPNVHSGAYEQHYQSPPPPGFKTNSQDYQVPPPPGFKSSFTGHLHITGILLPTAHGLVQLLHPHLPVHLALHITVQHLTVQKQDPPLVLEVQKGDEVWLPLCLSK